MHIGSLQGSWRFFCKLNYLIMKARLIILSLLAVIMMACKSDIKPEMRDEMQAIVKQSVYETLLNKADYKYSDLEFKLNDVKEEQFEYDGDKYGTYQGEFVYSFNDGDKSVKVMGIAVFSYDLSLSFVNGCRGIFVDAISVNSTMQKLEDSKYYFNQCDWE